MKFSTLGTVILIVCLLSVLFSVRLAAAPHGTPFVVQDFEGENFVVRPRHPPTDYRHFEWSFVDAENGVPRLGSSEFTNNESRQGDRSLMARINGVPSAETYGSLFKVTNIYVHYYPYDDNNFTWNYLREQEALKGKTGYQTNHYNRMRFWIKVPPENVQADIKTTNFHVGTYYRASNGDRTSAESGGNHFYHYYNLPYMDGVWHQVIVDTHPNHIRGKGGNTEHGNREYPTGESNLNYFDLMTRFYMKFLTQPSSYPAIYHFDDAELYHDPNNENIDQIYAMHGSYSNVGGKNKLLVGWNTDKNENNINQEVRYSFEDIHDLGWGNATPAPNGVIDPPGSGGYNGVEYQTAQIAMANHEQIFIAIKPANSNLFRQIIIPLNDDFTPTPIKAPPSPPPYFNINISQ